MHVHIVSCIAPKLGKLKKIFVALWLACVTYPNFPWTHFDKRWRMMCLQNLGWIGRKIATMTKIVWKGSDFHWHHPNIILKRTSLGQPECARKCSARSDCGDWRRYGDVHNYITVKPETVLLYLLPVSMHSLKTLLQPKYENRGVQVSGFYYKTAGWEMLSLQYQLTFVVRAQRMHYLKC